VTNVIVSQQSSISTFTFLLYFGFILYGLYFSSVVSFLLSPTIPFISKNIVGKLDIHATSQQSSHCLMYHVGKLFFYFHFMFLGAFHI
jgi:hypothetical protein